MLSDVPWNVQIGRAILRGTAIEAVKVILTANDGYPPRISAALSHFSSSEKVNKIESKAPILQSSYEVLQHMPRSAHTLRTLLRELRRQTKRELALDKKRKGETWSEQACRKSLSVLSYRERQRWLQAYQSYIWNLTASEFYCDRKKSQGTIVQRGDQIAAERSASYKPLNSTVRGIITASSANIEEKFIERHIVIPFPGYKCLSERTTAQSAAGQKVSSILARDGIDYQKFQNNLVNVRCPGSYRRLIGVPKNMTCSLVKDKKSAIDLVFDLGVSSYATSFLRELTKMNLIVGNSMRFE